MCVPSHTLRERWWSSLITMCMVVLFLIAHFVLCLCGSSLWQNSIQQRRVPFLCSWLHRAFCTVRAVLKTVTNHCTGKLVVSSDELVSCGNRRNSDAVVEWIPAAMLVQFARWLMFARLLRLVCNRVGSVVLLLPSFDYLWFSGPT